MMIGYPKHRWLGFWALVIAAGALEFLQNVVPGRHGRWHDFDAKAAGVMAGALLGLASEATAVARSPVVTLRPTPPCIARRSCSGSSP